jgi:hypothetical protein
MAIIEIDLVRLWEEVKQPGGTTCPACRQHAQAYKRKVHAKMARSLILMHHADPTGGWIDITTRINFVKGKLVGPGVEPDTRLSDEGKLEAWGLVEVRQVVVQSGVTRADFWRVTDRGRDFVLDRIRIAKYILFYNDDPLGVVEPDKVAGIRDALSTKWNYDDLMRGV